MTIDEKQELIALVVRDILNVGAIYRTLGNALYDEPVQRMAERIVSTVEKHLDESEKSQLKFN